MKGPQSSKSQLYAHLEKLDNALKTFRKKANIPGFRPGTVPVGMVKKMYGKSILAEEINKMVGESLYNYIQENKLNVLGEPLPNEEKQEAIDFSTEGVGGPSAGLMFTLDIYDQLVGTDLRKGRIIAGTGTIEADGSVGDIGGAGLKVVSAAESGAEIFFVPNNPVDEATLKANPDAQTNYQEALAAAKKIGTKMKIVPVTTAQEAIDYLKKTGN